MKFQTEIEIDRPLDQVWAAFVDRSLMARWQGTLRAVEPISGQPYEVGAITHLTYREAGQDVWVEEEVIESNKPTTLVCSLTSSIMTSTMANRFTSLAGGQTRWVVECEIHFRGVFRLLGLFGKQMIVRKTREDMNRFKRLVVAQPLDGTAKSPG